MSRAPIAILSAIGEELSGFRLRTRDRRRVERSDGLKVESGWLFGHPVLLASTGDGAVAAQTGLRRLLEEHSIRTVLIVGLGGGLVPGLEVGSVVFAEEVRHVSGASVRVSAHWHQRAVEASLRREIIVSAPKLVGTAVQKSWLRSTREGRAPAVTDLESYALVTEAERAGCEWAVLRAVSDVHDEALPKVVLDAQDANGAVRRARVVAGALRRPSTFQTLWALRTRARHCSERLALHAERLLTSI